MDYPAPRTTAAHQHCLFCEARQNLHVVALSIRKSVFNRAEIFIPAGCRTRESHVFDFETPIEVLRSLHTVSSRSLIEKSELKCFLCESAGAARRCVQHVESRMTLRNTLGDEEEAERWNRRSTTLESISADELTIFPVMTEESLLTVLLPILFTSGPFQLRTALSYLGELTQPNNEVPMKCVKLKPTIIRVDIRSRHSENVVYRVYAEYEPGMNSVEGIKRYYCECKNGARTIGYCSHAATVVFYLSYARWQPQVPRPADQLSELFEPVFSDSESEDAIAEPSQ